MRNFWDGLVGISKVLIIAVACLLGLSMLTTCSLFGTIITN